jgi:hypothetical protein
MALDFGFNWVAVIIATIVYFAIGFAWYLPSTPTGKMWAESTGTTVDPSGPRPNPIIYAFPIISYLVTSIATAMLARRTGTDDIVEGIILGLVVGVGYSAALLFTTAAFETKKPQPWMWALNSSAFNIVSLVVVGVIVALIR